MTALVDQSITRLTNHWKLSAVRGIHSSTVDVGIFLHEVEKKRLIAPDDHDTAICNAMQCSAMPCHAALLTRSQPILKQARRWASKPEKNENRKGTRAAYCLLWPGEERRLRQSHPIPSIKRHPNRPSPRTRGKKRNRKSPDYEKLRQFSRSVPVIPLARRENNQHK